MRSPRPTSGPPAQDSSARKISPHNFWLWKPAGIELVEEAAGAISSSSWGTHTRTHLLRLAPSQLQHWGGSLKETSGIQGETEVSGIGESRGLSTRHHRASKLVPYLTLYHPPWLSLCDPPWRSTETLSHPIYRLMIWNTQTAFPRERLILAPKSYQTSKS